MNQVQVAIQALRVEYGPIYTVVLPKGTLDQTGMLEVDTYVREYFSAHGVEVVFPPDFSWEVVNRNGTLTKRIQKYIHGTYGKVAGEMFQSIAGKVGSMIGDYAPEGQTFHFSFLEKLGWGRNDYGDGTSCFHNEPEKMRRMGEAGVHAMIFWKLGEDGEDNKGLGRALFKQFSPDTITVFNTYGKMYPEDVMADESDENHSKTRQDTKSIRAARILASHFGMHYRKVTLTNNQVLKENDGILYINGNTGWVVGNYLTIRLLESQDFKFKPTPPPQCEKCGGRVAKKEDLKPLVVSITGRTVKACGDCHTRYVKPCVTCKKPLNLLLGTHVVLGDQIFCGKTCANNAGYRECDRCGEIYPKTGLFPIVPGQVYCRNCIHEYAYACTRCSRLFHLKTRELLEVVRYVNPNTVLYCPECGGDKKEAKK